MTRPIASRSGVLCHGAAGDAVELQRAGGLKTLKQDLYDAGRDAGFKEGFAAGYSAAFADLERRVSSIENVMSGAVTPGGPRPAPN